MSDQSQIPPEPPRGWRGRFVDTLAEAFPSRKDMSRLLLELDESLDKHVGDGGSEEIAVEVHKWAKGEYRLKELVIAACLQKPYSNDLRELAKEFGITDAEIATQKRKKQEQRRQRFLVPIAFAVTALLLVLAVAAWIRGWIGPTRTTFELTGASENWIRVHVTNHGPKASDLAGFRLKFTRLPIEDAPLQIVGTDDATLRLKANSEADVFLHAWELVTKCDPETSSRPPFQKIEKSVAGAGATLGIEVRDAGSSAGKPRPGSQTFSAQRLYKFIEKRVSEYAHPCTEL